MMKKIIITLIFISISVFFNNLFAQYNTVYVNLDIGDDSYTGSSSTYDGGNIGPKATIQAGINVTNLGGTCYVAPGTYNSSSGEIFPIDLTGITLVSEMGADVTIIDADLEDTIIRYFGGDASLIGFTIANAHPYGIFAGDYSSSSFKIERNVIVGTYGTGIFVYGTVLYRITNNTIVDNMYYGLFANQPNPIIRNNIITGSDMGIGCSNGATPSFYYNNFWNNSIQDYYHCSSGNNDIHLNPLFIDLNQGNYHIQVNSPCIDAGDPSSSYNDPDGTRNDIGAFFYDPNLSTIDDLILDVKIYPNPTKGEIYINTNSLYSIKIMNTIGQTIFEENMLINNFTKTIDLSNYEKGIYYIKIQSRNDSVSEIIIKE